MRQQLDFKDTLQFTDALLDQDALMLDVSIKRCIGVNNNSRYPGDPMEVLRAYMFTRAEVKPIPMGEVSRNGDVLAVGDLMIRINIQLRGVEGKEYPTYGDKINPENVADIIIIEAPYQGEWFVVGIPEPVQLNANQEPIFWNANIRRIRRGNLGK